MAKEAADQSLVLLKNDQKTLPFTAPVRRTTQLKWGEGVSPIPQPPRMREHVSCDMHAALLRRTIHAEWSEATKRSVIAEGA